MLRVPSSAYTEVYQRLTGGLGVPVDQLTFDWSTGGGAPVIDSLAKKQLIRQLTKLIMLIN